VLSTRRASALRRERTAALRIPYTAHVAERVVKTALGDYLQAFRLGGASFESADDEQLNSWHERLNVLWRNLASPNIALWTHVVRRPERAQQPVTTGRGFVDVLTARYRERLAGETLMVNELYLALLYRPAAGLAAGMLSRALSRTRSVSSGLELADALDACAKLGQMTRASLVRYEPEALGTYRWGSTWCSSLLEYLALLINGEWRRVPLPAGLLSEGLATTRLLFGTETIEYRTPSATRVGAMLGIKEYPTPSVIGMYNRLLSAPFPLVLTQSFAFLSRAAGQALLQRQFYRMANAGDFSRHLADRYKVAVDLAVHEPRPGGDPRNFHAHLLTTTREVTPAGLGAKAGLDLQALERRRRELPDHRQEYLILRERWATLVNEALREANVAARVDHRSLAAQGIDREPLPRIPLMQLKMEQRGVRSELAERLRAEYRERVQRRLERSPARSPLESAPGVAGARAAEGGDKEPHPPAQIQDVEEIRRQAREAWLRLRPKEAERAGAERTVREREAFQPSQQAEDDLAR